MYYWFKIRHDDKLTFRHEGSRYIDITIYQDNGTVALKPEHNWNGEETITFFATDGETEISDVVKITVEAINDPPEPAYISRPMDGIEIKDGELLDFEGSCTDVDLIYGDELIFEWSSNISGVIGFNENLEDVLLDAGNHFISLKVSDLEGKYSIESITVIVSKEPVVYDDDDKDNDGLPNLWEKLHGLDPSDPSDVRMDADSDGLTNYQEYEMGTDPNNPDTDTDGYNDGNDLFPLDQSRWELANIDQEGESDSTMIYLLIILVAVIVVILVFLFILKPRMGNKTDEGIVTEPASVQQPQVNNQQSQTPQYQSPQYIQPPQPQTQPSQLQQPDYTQQYQNPEQPDQ
jgi:hypothetical protein